MQHWYNNVLSGNVTITRCFSLRKNLFLFSNVSVLGECDLDVRQSCGYGKDQVDDMRTELEYVKSICDEDNHINKGIF